LFITFEAPLSGMSLNPARTFGSALVASQWNALWLYFVAPPLGMLGAATFYTAVRRGRQLACAKIRHDAGYRCIFCEYQQRLREETIVPEYRRQRAGKF